MDNLKTTRCGQTEFRWGERTYIMGIVNVSPDSFSGDGLTTVEAAVQQAREMLGQGSDILDIGGESTRPGSGSCAPAGQVQAAASNNKATATRSRHSVWSMSAMSTHRSSIRGIWLPVACPAWPARECCRGLWPEYRT